jgi:ubiquinone/menaquinone biosynthesis C-methylase UbiE
MESTRTYLPAAGHDWLLPLYDPFVKLFGGDALRRALLKQAALRPSQRVLDVGCGTGTLATMIKRLHPDVEVVGLDPDSKALARARRKVARAALSIQFDQGFADELPYPEASFDRALSSFMFHHLPPDEKGRMLRAVRRVLKPETWRRVSHARFRRARGRRPQLPGPLTSLKRPHGRQFR